MMNGIIVVLKPSQMTSHDVVSFLRRQLKTKRIGHTGTLDPDAIGVLPICVGNATRIAEYMSEQGKAYRAELSLGLSTSTQDASGQELSRSEDFSISLEQFNQILPSFRGDIEQIPPMMSAVSINGQRLYQLARQGIEVEREPRKVCIHSLEISRAPQTLGFGSKILLDLHCSKGTYVRTICHDIGERLGVGAHMSFLLRTASGSFDLDDAFTLEEIESAVNLGQTAKLFRPVSEALQHLPSVVLAPEYMAKFQNGMTVPYSFHQEDVASRETVVVFNEQQEVVAIAHHIQSSRGSWLKPHKVLMPA